MENLPRLLPFSGGLLAACGVSWFAEASWGPCFLLSRGLLPVHMPVSKCPLFIRTSVISIRAHSR